MPLRYSMKIYDYKNLHYKGLPTYHLHQSQHICKTFKRLSKKCFLTLKSMSFMCVWHAMLFQAKAKPARASCKQIEMWNTDKPPFTHHHYHCLHDVQCSSELRQDDYCYCCAKFVATTSFKKAITWMIVATSAIARFMKAKDLYIIALFSILKGFVNSISEDH